MISLKEQIQKKILGRNDSFPLKLERGFQFMDLRGRGDPGFEDVFLHNLLEEDPFLALLLLPRTHLNGEQQEALKKDILAHAMSGSAGMAGVCAVIAADEEDLAAESLLSQLLSCRDFEEIKALRTEGDRRLCAMSVEEAVKTRSRIRLLLAMYRHVTKDKVLALFPRLEVILLSGSRPECLSQLIREMLRDGTTKCLWRIRSWIVDLNLSCIGMSRHEYMNEAVKLSGASFLFALFSLEEFISREEGQTEESLKCWWQLLADCREFHEEAFLPYETWLTMFYLCRRTYLAPEKAKKWLYGEPLDGNLSVSSSEMDYLDARTQQKAFLNLLLYQADALPLLINRLGTFNVYRFDPEQTKTPYFYENREYNWITAMRRLQEAEITDSGVVDVYMNSPLRCNYQGYQELMRILLLGRGKQQRSGDYVNVEYYFRRFPMRGRLEKEESGKIAIRPLPIASSAPVTFDGRWLAFSGDYVARAYAEGGDVRFSILSIEANEGLPRAILVADDLPDVIEPGFRSLLTWLTQIWSEGELSLLNAMRLQYARVPARMDVTDRAGEVKGGIRREVSAEDGHRFDMMAARACSAIAQNGKQVFDFFYHINNLCQGRFNLYKMRGRREDIPLRATAEDKKVLAALWKEICRKQPAVNVRMLIAMNTIFREVLDLKAIIGPPEDGGRFRIPVVGSPEKDGDKEFFFPGKLVKDDAGCRIYISQLPCQKRPLLLEDESEADELVSNRFYTFSIRGYDAEADAFLAGGLMEKRSRSRNAAKHNIVTGLSRYVKGNDERILAQLAMEAPVDFSDEECSRISYYMLGILRTHAGDSAAITRFLNAIEGWTPYASEPACEEESTYEKQVIYAKSIIKAMVDTRTESTLIRRAYDLTALKEVLTAAQFEALLHSEE